MNGKIYSKILTGALCAVLSAGAAYAETTVSVTYQSEIGKLKARLETDRPERGATAAVYDSKNNKYWVLTEFYRQSKDEFSYTGSLDPDMPSGEYMLTVTIGGEKATGIFEYINEKTATSAMEKVNAATKQNFAETIRSDGVYDNLAINLDEFNAYADDLTELYFLYKAQYVTAANPKGDLTVAEFSALYGKCRILCSMKGKTEPAAGQILKEKADAIDFDYAKFLKLSEEEQKEILGRFIKCSYDRPTLSKQYEIWFALADVNKKRANSVSVYAQAVESYAELFGLDLTAYNKLSNKDEVMKKVMAQDYDSPEALQSAIATYTKSVGKTGSSTGGSSSGGGGNSNGSSGSGIGSGGNTGSDIYVNSTSFTDVSASHWSATAVEAMFKRGVVSGMGDGSFMPDKPVTRAEFAKMLISALFAQTPAAGDAGFADVAADAWYASCINTAFELGIVSGVDASHFAPNAQISRQDMAVMLSRALEKINLRPAAQQKIFSDDAEIAQYAREAVALLGGAGILNGMGDNKFEPQGVLSRAQAVCAIYKTLEIIGRL